MRELTEEEEEEEEEEERRSKERKWMRKYIEVPNLIE